MDDCSMKNDFNGCFNTFEGGKGLVKISGEKLRARQLEDAISLAMKMGIRCIGWWKKYSQKIPDAKIGSLKCGLKVHQSSPDTKMWDIRVHRLKIKAGLTMTSQETLASKLNSSKPYSVACVYGCMNEFGQQRWGEFIDLSWNMDDQCSYVSHINECKKKRFGYCFGSCTSHELRHNHKIFSCG